MKHYIIYQIKNKLNNMIYIGQHQTENVDDGYMGSGLRIKRAIEKYGIENFEKTILFECNSEEEMNQKEAEIVNEDFIARDDVYNIVPGGWSGSFKILSFETKSKASKKRWQNMSKEKKQQISDKVRNFQLYRTQTKEFREKISASLKEAYKRNPLAWGMTGKHASNETKEKISNSVKGSKNGNYGHHWWKDPNDKTKSLSIKEGDPVPEGWIRGKWFIPSEQFKQHCNESAQNRVGEIHITNGIITKCIMPNEKIPEGFVIGNKPLSQHSHNVLSQLAITRNKKRHEQYLQNLKEQYEYFLENGWDNLIKKFNIKVKKSYFLSQCKKYFK